MFRYLLMAVGLLVALLVVQFVHFAVVMGLSDQQSNQGNYFARSRRERARFRRRIQWHAWLLTPLFWLLSKVSSVKLKDATFHYQGVPGPKGACDAASFARGADYRPRPEDVFVVTQMKCGTTWMQQLVYQLLHRGQHDLTESGAALYGLSPWLESRKTMPAELGPPLGQERPARLIKTHLPVALCPYDAAARYIYVVRHPVSCFASCVDFLGSNLGRMAPSLDACEQWFCSPDLMWWSPWPEHVAGWWQRSRQADNVLFVRFEDMKQDLAAVARQVAEFLGIAPLNDQETARVLQHSSFQWMSDNFDLFEMYVPHLLQNSSGFFKSGRTDRHQDVPPEMSQRILTWCDGQLGREGLSVARWYPSA
jgi:hypothetical protein